MLSIPMPHGFGLALVLTLPSLCIVPEGFGQFADSVDVVHIGGSVYMLRGAGDVITASVGEDGILLVDGGFEHTEEAVRAALGKLAPGSPKYIVNSHWHHAGANAVFAAGATIIAHRLARERLRDGSMMYTQEVGPAAPEALPDVVVDDSMSLFFNGEEIQIIHLPAAHTDGDLVVHFMKSGVASLGDVFVTLIPVTDYASGGDLYQSVRAIEYLLERLPPTTRLVPGHGRPASYADLRRFHEMLTGMIAYMESEVAAGQTQEQVVAKGIPPEWIDWLDLIPAEFVLTNFYEGVIDRSDRRPPG